MARIRIVVSPSDMEALQDLQDQALRYLIEPDELSTQWASILTKYVNPPPTPYDTTEIVVERKRVYSGATL